MRACIYKIARYDIWVIINNKFNIKSAASLIRLNIVNQIKLDIARYTDIQEMSNFEWN